MVTLLFAYYVLVALSLFVLLHKTGSCFSAAVASILWPLILVVATLWFVCSTIWRGGHHDV